MFAVGAVHLNTKQSSGFTLLELVLVLFLIGLLASAGLLFTDNFADQARFEDTQTRLALIRKAIVQAGDRTVNNQPELRGFVVDNGRLPYCLAELTGPAMAFTNSVSAPDTYYQSPCSANTNLTLPMFTVSEQGIHHGWHGPYIQTQAADSRLGSFENFNRSFRDGFNNDLLIDDYPTLNYGWIWTLAPSQSAQPFDADDLINIYNLTYDPSINPIPTYLTVQSLGFDPVMDSDNFPADPINDFLVQPEDWLYQGGIAVQFVNTSSESAIGNWSDIDGSDWQFTLTKAVSGIPAQVNAANLIFTPASSSLSSGEMQQYFVELGSDPSPIPVGYYLVEITCDDAATDCPVMVSQPYTIGVFPRQQLAPIRWNIRP